MQLGTDDFEKHEAESNLIPVISIDQNFLKIGNLFAGLLSLNEYKEQSEMQLPRNVNLLEMYCTSVLLYGVLMA